MERADKYANSVLQNGKEQQQRRYSEKTADVRLISLVFTRFSDLFGSKCNERGLVISNDDGEYTGTFLLWCRKLYGLSAEDVKRGMNELESRARIAGHDNKEYWPPSYAEFYGMCEDSRPCAAHKLYPKMLPEPPESISKRRKAGERELGRLMDMFNS